jgi:PiT family inorganic phosphate transporter
MLIATVVALIAVALAFDFINGFHDAANSIATVVSTRVLSPLWAVAWAAFFNFISAAPVLWGAELKVAATMGKGIVDFSHLKEQGTTVVLTVVFAALMGAIVWNLLTWWWGLPSSSSHALAGGMIGATIPSIGFDGLLAPGIIKIVAFIVLSPLIGLTLGASMMILTAWLVRRNTPARVDGWFRRLQLVSAAAYSLMHGANDAQKTMGIIAGVLFTAGYLSEFTIPFWVVIAAHTAIGLGTLSGGWRIIHTMGSKITKLQPVHGFAAETGAAIAIYTATALGVGISTTHTITGAIVGVGATRRLSAVRWGVAGRIVWAWLATIPGAAAIGALSYGACRLAGLT